MKLLNNEPLKGGTEGKVNRMSDLISRKALKQAIYIDFCEHFTQCHDSDQKALIDMVMNDIDEIPAAFDKEKVIEELEYYLFEKYCVEGDEKVAEIVEKGGIK